MIYSTSRQRRIVDSRYTAATLFICSLLIWGAGALFDIGSVASHMPAWAGGIAMYGTLPLRVAALLLYGFAAFLVSSYVVLERRVTWQPYIMLFVAAATFDIQPDALSALILLVLTAIIGMVFSLDTAPDVRRRLYCISAVAASAALLFPQLLFLLPLPLLYPILAGRLTTKAFLASLLGTATPVWIFAALLYLFPQLQSLLDSSVQTFAILLQAPRVSLTPSMLLMLLAEFAVMVPAIVHYFVTASIGRTHLRRRMTFCIVLDMVMWLAGWLQPEFFMQFFIWRLSVNSLLAAYIFTVLPSKVSNIYFISTTLLWLSSLTVKIWIG